MKNPKVNTKDRIVCAFSKSLGMYSFHRIKKDGTVSEKGALPTVVAESFSEAVDRANEIETGKSSKGKFKKIKKARFNMVVTDIKICETWNEYIELAWKNSN